MKRALKKYLVFRFNVYYICMFFVYILQPILKITGDIFSYDEIDYYDYAVCILTGLVCIFMYMFAIIPTVVFLKMNKVSKRKDYWYEDVFTKEKVYGSTRKLIIINLLIFSVTQICIIIERIVLHRTVFTEFFWAPLVSLMLSFGITSLMSGMFLEFRKNKYIYI